MRRGPSGDRGEAGSAAQTAADMKEVRPPGSLDEGFIGAAVLSRGLRLSQPVDHETVAGERCGVVAERPIDSVERHPQPAAAHLVMETPSLEVPIETLVGAVERVDDR